LLNTTLCSDEFPFVRNKIALKVHRVTLGIPASDLVKPWVRAHHFFASFVFRGCFPVVCRILPKTPQGKYRQTGCRKMRNCRENQQRSSTPQTPYTLLLIFPTDFISGQQIYPAPCCTYTPRFLNDDKPAFSVFSSVISQSFGNAERFIAIYSDFWENRWKSSDYNNPFHRTIG